MKLSGSDLFARIQRQGADADKHTVQVPRADSPARADGYRSGWVRVPQVPPLMRMQPATRKDPAIGRSSSAPGTSRDATASNCKQSSFPWPTASKGRAPTSSGNALVRTGSVPLGGRAQTHQTTGALESNCISASDLGQSSTQLLSTNHVSSDVECESIASSQSGRSTTLLASLAATDSTAKQGVQHCGWLAKQTSGKVATRWQQRYFTLDGSILRYQPQPGALSRKSFDLRKVKRISSAAVQPREFDLDFGFRVWRLRAESPEAARRWLVLLEAATLVGSNLVTNEDEFANSWSDGEPSSAASTVSTVDSITAAEAQHNRSQAATCSTPSRPRPTVVVDTLELDPAALDKQFDTWFQLVFQENEHEQERPSNLMQDALSVALCGLWCTFGVSKNAADSVTGTLAEAAAEALRDSRLEPEALRMLIEEVLGEYLERMQQQVKRWLQQDPCVSAVAKIVGWLLLEARPALDRFATCASKLLGLHVNGWPSMAMDLEQLLLGDWEIKAMDDACHRCEHGYEAVSLHSDQEGGCSIETDSNGPDTDISLCKPALEVLEETLKHNSEWRSHPGARDRTACVLVAALSATLRAHNSHARSLLAPTEIEATVDSGTTDVGPGRKRKKLRRAGLRLLEIARRALKEIPCSTDEPSAVPSAVALVTSTASATQLAKFCNEAAATPGIRLGAALGTDAFPAFAVAFERQGIETSEVLAEMNFASTCRFALNQICFNPRVLQDLNTSPPSMLASPCTSAHAFLEELFDGGASPPAWQACAAIARLLVRRWARAFCKAAPKMRTCRGLIAAVEADEAALLQLAQRWGIAEFGPQDAGTPEVPLQEVARMLRSPTPKTMSTGTKKLELAIGATLSRNLVSAVRTITA